jgi:hypothetical protein
MGLQGTDFYRDDLSVYEKSLITSRWLAEKENTQQNNGYGDLINPVGTKICF